MKLSSKQKEYINNATHRWNVKQGATRSGKTYLDIQYTIPMRIRATLGQGLIVLLGNTKGTLERNVLEPMRALFGDILVGYIGSDNKVSLFGKECYALGADKVNQVKKLQGAAFEYCYGDEITTWNEDVFQMLKSRISCENSIFDGTCNPDNPEHWFKKFLDSNADIYQQKYTIDDNPFLPKIFVDNLKTEYAGTVYYDRFILGLWQKAEGLVYSVFDKMKHVIEDVIVNKGMFYISVDYGTANPFSAGLWKVNGRTEAIRIKEYYYNGRELKRFKTDEEYYQELEALAGDRYIQYVVVDPSAKSFIETINRHGKFMVRKAINDVQDGIRYVCTLLNQEKLKFCLCCKDAIREFNIYSRDPKSNADEVIKENDHAMDDIRYFCNTILRMEWS